MTELSNVPNSVSNDVQAFFNDIPKDGAGEVGGRAIGSSVSVFSKDSNGVSSPVSDDISADTANRAAEFSDDFHQSGLPPITTEPLPTSAFAPGEKIADAGKNGNDDCCEDCCQCFDTCCAPEMLSNCGYFCFICSLSNDACSVFFECCCKVCCEGCAGLT